jgi:hypothetical protein
MIIAPQQFQNSFYYIAPGKDFEPLLRYSHQCKNFFFANLAMEKEVILDYIDRYFRDNFFLQLLEKEVYDGFDETTYFELHPQYRHHLSNVQFLGTDAYQEYLSAFSPELGKKQWMIRLKILRKDLNRELQLFYFTGEGLASYIALSHNGRYQPKVICTIETKVLERNHKIMINLFEQLGSAPEQWIRGFEGEKDVLGNGYYFQYSDNNPALQRDNVYNRIGMNFSFQWNVEGTYGYTYEDLSRPTTRFSKAFIRQETSWQIESRLFRHFDNHRIMYGDFYDIAASDTDSVKWLIVTSNFDRERLKKIPFAKVITWELALQPKGGPIKKASLKQSLAKLEKLLRNAGPESPTKVFFVPFGLEDEGEILASFFNSFNGPQLNAVVNHPLDLVDLREQ